MIFESHDSAIAYAHAPKCASRTVLAWLNLAANPHLLEQHPDWFAKARLRSDGEYGPLRRRVATWPHATHHFPDGVLPQTPHALRVGVVRDPVSRFVSAFENRVLHHRYLAETFPHVTTLPAFIEAFDDIMAKSQDVQTHFRPLWQFVGQDPSWFTHVYTLETLDHLRKGLSVRFGTALPPLQLQQSGGCKAEVTTEARRWILDHYAQDVEAWQMWAAKAQATLREDDWTVWQQPVKLPKPVYEPGQTVVLVGNGPSVLDTRLGKVIDAFDLVVRFNAFEIEGYEQDVGTRTSLWSTHGGCTALPREPHLPRRGILVYETSESGLPLDDVWRVPRKFWLSVRDRLRAESEQANRDTINPSSGLVVILWFLECLGAAVVHLAGMDHFSKEHSGRHHYWEAKRYSRPPELDGDAEARVLKPYLKQRRVRYLT